MYQLKMQSTLLVNVKELVKSSYKTLLFASLIILFSSCQDRSFTSTTYNEKLLSEPTKCLKLKLNPYSKELYNEIKNISNFDNNCQRVLEIKYKTNIICNSQFNTNKQFKSFIELNLLENDKLIHIIYKDLEDEDIADEIKKGYSILWKTINH